MGRLVAVVTVCLAAVSPAFAGNGPKPPTGFWVAGDLHVHTIYGHDTCITPTQAWDPSSPDRSARTSCGAAYPVSFTPAQRFGEALARGLDFLAITDHNNVVNQSDPAELTWLAAHPSFVAIPAYENSQPGHVQMLGARACYANAGPVLGATVECDHDVTDRSAAGETALANALRANGGVFQINHPSDMNWLSRFGYSVVPDTVEVWNIGPWIYQHPFPASNDNNFSLDWYDGFLRAGYEVGTTGGSDSHWVLTDAAQGVGEPTTWVFVRTLSLQGVLDGIRAHHTFVSALPPALHGPQLFLEADGHGDGVFESIAGSETKPGATYRVRTVGALPGSVLRIVTDTGKTEISLGAAATYTFRPGTGGVPAAASFVRVELLVPDARALREQTCGPILQQVPSTLCDDDLLMEALTSPIFVR